MKRSLYGLIMITVLCFGPNSIIVGSSFDDPSDYKVVNAIKRVSNLSQEYADRIKLTWLGKLQDYVAGTAGMFAAFQGGMQAYKFGDWAETELVGTPEKSVQPGLLQMYLSTTLFNVISDKRFWVFAGVAGAAGVSYKILEPRLARGIIDRVRTFVEMCENLDVYNFNYAQYGGLASMGSATAKSDGTPYDPQWLSVNAAWAASNIAREKGIVNLLAQADVAIDLLAQVQNTDEVKDLRLRVGKIKGYLTNNKPIIQWEAQQERAERSREFAGQQQAADLDLTKQKTSALWYTKLSIAATALGNFVQGTLKTLAYIHDNSGKIAGGAVAAVLLPYAIKKAWDLQTAALPR